MSRIKRILCEVLLLAVVAVGGLAWWQRDNIGALITGLRYSQTELEDQLQQNDQTIKDAMQVVPEVSIRDMTEEDKQALKDGTMTREELIESLIEPVQKPEDKPATSPEVQPEKTDKPDSSVQQPEEDPPAQPEQESPQVSDYQKKLASIIAEVYVLREEFLIKLDNLLAEAKAEYVLLPKEDRTGTKLTALASGYYARAHDMELECDAHIKEIIDRMETLLKENEQDLSIAQAVYDTYLNEKSLKKSWYLAELKKRGI